MRNKTSEHRGAIRLHSCAGKGGLKLLRRLQTMWWAELTFEFQVDPYGEVATIISDIIRFCKMHYADTIDNLLDEPDFIEAVGELNMKIADLYSHAVNVYYGEYLYWDVECGEHNGKPIHLPKMNDRLKIVFSEDCGPLLPQVVRFSETKEVIFSRCHLRNHGNGIQLSELPSHDETKAERPSFLKEYFAAYEAFQRSGAKIDTNPIP